MPMRKLRRNSSLVTPEHVARWLAARFRRHRSMSHDLVVSDVRSCFGKEFSQTDGAGRLTFTEPVLTAFHMLTGNRVKHDQANGLWR